MKTYKELRQHYRLQIYQGECRCVLSGLNIYDPKLLSLEHLIPISRGEWNETHKISNIFPAYKIINNIKSSLLPCEWIDSREYLLQKSLRKDKLHRVDKEVVKAAIDNIPYYNINPCTICIWKNICELER